MGKLLQKSPIVWAKTPIVWVPGAYTMAENFTPTMSKIPLQWAKFTSTMAQSTSTMAQYHLYYGPIPPLLWPNRPILWLNWPILWLNITDTMAQFHSIHLYYGCLRPTSPSNPQAHAPSPGYTETKSAVPRKRISENNPTRETYKQAHPTTHRDPGASRQSPSGIAAGAHVGDGVRKTLDTHATQNGTR
jgi:hypothetical protein